MSIKIRKRDINVFFIGLLFFTFCILLRQFTMSSAIAFCGFIFFCFYLFNESPVFLIKYLYVFFTTFSEVVGCLVIEYNDLYLNEIDAYSHYVGALPTLLFAHWLLIYVIFIVDRILTKDGEQKYGVPDKNTKWMDYICYAVTIFSICIFLKVIAHPAFLMGLDRFTYGAGGYITGIWAKLANAIQYLIIVPIIAFVRGKKKLGLAAIIPYILYLVWTGNKFGVFFNIFYVFLLCYYEKFVQYNKSKLKKILVKLGGIVGALVGLSLFIITFSLDTPIQKYFYNRIAQQGELWWKTYEQCYEIHPAEFKNELIALVDSKEAIADNVGSDYGIYNIMYYVAPKQKIDYKLMSGSRYSCAGFANIYYYFSYFGLVIHSVIFGVITAFTVNGVVYSLRSGQYLKAAILYRLFVAERGALSMYLFNDLFDGLSFLSYIYLIFLGKKRKIRIGKR